jgi:hypothetical protein
MSRPKKCKLCTGDPAIAGQVNALLETGVKLRTIVEEHPEFSVYQLSRHRNKCLMPNFASELSPESGSAEIQKWLERAESTYLLAQANGDSRSASSAISVAVRALTSLQKQIAHETEIEQAATADNNPNRPFTIAELDKIMAEHYAKLEAEENFTREKARTLLDTCPQFAELVFTCWKTRSLIPEMLALAKNQNGGIHAIAN